MLLDDKIDQEDYDNVVATTLNPQINQLVAKIIKLQNEETTTTVDVAEFKTHIP